MMPRRRAAGFTIIEMMATVVMVSILATVAIPVAEVAVRRGKEQELRHALRQVREALDDYREAVDEGRIERVAGTSGYPPHLSALVDGVIDAKDPQRRRIFFLRRVPGDPFADPSITPELSWGLRSYESTAEHPAPGKDVFDVYSLSGRTGLNGVPYKEW